MHGISTNPVCWGRCGQCGRTQRLTAGAVGDVPEKGEEFSNRYCCAECLDEHGATTHTRVSIQEHRGEL